MSEKVLINKFLTINNVSIRDLVAELFSEVVTECYYLIKNNSKHLQFQP